MIRNIVICLAVFSLSLLTAAGAVASSVQLPRTGQTLCYDTVTNVPTDCASTGQDGTWLAGKPWPSPRFTAANGAVTDNLTGLIWLQNANCFGVQTWAAALASANALKGDNSQCGLNDGSAAGQWRLPNRKELQSLLDLQQASAPLLPDGGIPFATIQSQYWSSTTATSSSYAWSVGTNGGLGLPASKVETLSVWPVRGGN